MIRLRSLLFVCGSVAAMLAVGILALPVLLVARERAGRIPARFAAFQLGLLRTVVGLDLDVRGLEHVPRTPALIAVKHQSVLETYALCRLFPGACFVLKREIVRVPVVGWFIAAMDVIAVDRAGGAAALRTMLSGARTAIDSGRHVIVFPEGTRTAPGTGTRYHPGIAALHGALGVPVVPVAVNTGLFWAPRHLVKRPGRAVLEFLEPLAPAMERRQFMSELEDRIESGTRRLVGEAEFAAGP